jgi:protein Tex
VGQYQHDLSEQKLSRSLDAVVEDCVNAVGVDVNTASTPLLSRVSGIGEGLARSIVDYREAHGPFRTRAVLKKVPRLGPKAFELSAGFLRISNGDDPLDASGVHPEAYPVVRRILAATKSQLKRLIGNTSVLRQLEPEAFTDAVFGVPTVTDILQELEKPGRDPRPAFKTASFREGVGKLEDLKPGMGRRWGRGIASARTRLIGSETSLRSRWGDLGGVLWSAALAGLHRAASSTRSDGVLGRPPTPLTRTTSPGFATLRGSLT